MECNLITLNFEISTCSYLANQIKIRKRKGGETKIPKSGWGLTTIETFDLKVHYAIVIEKSIIPSTAQFNL